METWKLIGSPLFSVESELRQSEFARHKVKHGDEMGGGTITSSFAFGRAEHAVQSFHKGVGHAPFPVGQDSRQMRVNHLRQLHHRKKETALIEPSGPMHPATPHSKSMPRRIDIARAIDVLED